MDEGRYYLGIFYFNKKDKRAIVPKINNWMGWTVNFARPEAYLIFFILALVVVITTNLK